MEPQTTFAESTTCMMSGDGAGAMARIVHNARHKPTAWALVYGLVPRPLPACEHCAKACAKDGFKVEWL